MQCRVLKVEPEGKPVSLRGVCWQRQERRKEALTGGTDGFSRSHQLLKSALEHSKV